MRTSPEEYAQLLANQKRVDHKQVKLDHVPTTEEVLGLQLTEAGIPFEREYCFDEKRKWRADYFIPGRLPLLIEVEGGTWLPGGGRHNRGKGFEDDCIKYAEAQILGYTVLRCTTRQVRSGRAIAWIMKLLARHTEES